MLHVKRRPYWRTLLKRNRDHQKDPTSQLDRPAPHETSSISVPQRDTARCVSLRCARAERVLQRKQSNVNYWFDIRFAKNLDDFVDDQGKSQLQEGAGGSAAPNDAERVADMRGNLIGERYDDDDLPI